MTQFFPRTLSMLAVSACFFALCLPVCAQSVHWHSGEEHIATTTVWHSGEVHAVADSSGLIIDPGGSLALEPGVVLKMGFNSFLRVNGYLDISGTADNPARIVSLRDDSIAGDTNGDAAATSPMPGDWRYISIDGLRYGSDARAHIQYAQIKHGGKGYPRGMTINLSEASEAKIEHCDFSEDSGPIFIDGRSKNISITSSNLYNPETCDYASSTADCHFDNGVKSFSGQPIDLTENYWGSPYGPTYTTGTIPEQFQGVVVANLGGSAMSYQPFADKPFVFGKQKLHPVILIPGLMGSWPDIYGGWRLDPILLTYEDLLAALRVAGYSDGKTLFPFPYDWSQSNTVTAGQLRDKINAAKAACVPSETFDCTKVDLISHSMGGLVARTYIEGSDYQHDVDKLIFIAVPQKGATFSYITWESGDVNQVMVFNSILKLFLEGKAELNGYKSSPLYDGVMHYIREMVSSVRELLPVFDYLIDKSSGMVRSYPNDYPRNLLLENLNTPDNLAKLKEVKMFNVSGDTGQNTINSLRVIPPLLYPFDGKWEHGIPENYNLSFTDRGIVLGKGDSMVPYFSSESVIGYDQIVVVGADHLSVVSKAQMIIIKWLTGKEPEKMVIHDPIKDILIFRIFSPADFQVIAPDGKRLGRDLPSSSTLSEIPAGYYSGYAVTSTPEMVIISNPISGNYRIKLLGVAGGGEYRMSVSAVTDGAATSSEYIGQVISGQQKLISVEYAEASTSLTALQPDISVKSAINDVQLLFERRLLLDSAAKQKIIAQYQSLAAQVAAVDILIKMANSALSILSKDSKSLVILRARLEAAAQTAVNQLVRQRSKMIADQLATLDAFLQKLLFTKALSSQGYDIIKSNNDYLLNNWK